MKSAVNWHTSQQWRIQDFPDRGANSWVWAENLYIFIGHNQHYFISNKKDYIKEAHCPTTLVIYEFLLKQNCWSNKAKLRKMSYFDGYFFTDRCSTILTLIYKYILYLQSSKHDPKFKSTVAHQPHYDDFFFIFSNWLEIIHLNFSWLFLT